MNRAEIIDELRDFIRTELLGEPDAELGVDEPLITSGRIDSFSIAQVAVFVETAFGVYVPDNELVVDNADTLAQMADLVLRYAADAATD